MHLIFSTSQYSVQTYKVLQMHNVVKLRCLQYAFKSINSHTRISIAEFDLQNISDDYSTPSATSGKLGKLWHYLSHINFYCTKLWNKLHLRVKQLCGYEAFNCDCY